MIGYVAVGSNQGERAERLERAFMALAGAGVGVRRVSRLYRTAPAGDASGRAWFLNGVVEIASDLPPHTLLRRLRAVERDLGRRRRYPERRKTPRTLDLDLIVYGRLRMRTPELTLPHPRFAQRAFVLRGMAELAPELRAPGSGDNMRRLLRRVRADAWKRA